MSSCSLSRVDYQRYSFSFELPCGSKVPEPRLCLAEGGGPEDWHLCCTGTCSCFCEWLDWLGERKQLLLTQNTAPSSTVYFSEGSKPLNGFIF